MHKIISVKGVLVGMLGLLMIGAWGFFSLNELKKQAQDIVSDTLPGLSSAGQANAYIADASRTLLFITIDDAEQRTELRNNITELSKRTTGYLKEYESQLNPADNEDRTNYFVLKQMRDDYIRIRDEVLNLASAGKKQEALARYSDTLLPAHARVKQASDKLFEYNMRQGELRGKKIMTICTITQIVLAVTSVGIFLIGFFVGFFK